MGLNSWKGKTREEVKILRAAYRKLHPEDPKRRKKAAKEYYQKNKIFIRKRAKLWTKRNLRRLFRNQLKRQYKLSLEQWDSLIVAQIGRCCICFKEMTGCKEPCVDHDHNTGRVRGLLCSGCNKGLGCFRDKAEFLKKAIMYLEKDIL